MNTARCSRLFRLLKKHGLTAAVTCEPSDIFYFTGLHVSGAYLLFGRGQAPPLRGFEQGQAPPIRGFEQEQAPPIRGFERGNAKLFVNTLYPYKRKWIAPLSELKNIKLGKTAIEPSKFSLASISAFHRMTGCAVIKKEPLFSKIRAIKEPGEIAKIDKAQKISRRLCGLLRLKKGMTEQDAAAFISSRAHSLAHGPSFEPIVAFGANSAYPHHVPSYKKYSSEDPALIDMGVRYKNYRADLTRMSGLFNIKTLSGGGKPRPYALSDGDKPRPYALLGRAYAAVKKSRELALPHIVPGAVIGSVAKMITDHLAEQGFEKNTLHSAGHGIGLDVHEWPAISCPEKGKFEKGMVFTLEPGLYFKGIGGVRVEDVYVLEDKVRILG